LTQGGNLIIIPPEGLPFFLNQVTFYGGFMKQNMGLEDRVIRLVAAIAVGVLYGLGYISGVLAIVLGVVAIAFFVTSLIGWCPLYLPLGLSTLRRKLSKQAP